MTRAGRPRVEVVDGKRPCTKCGQTKPVDQFYVSKGRVNSWCKGCMSEWNAERWRTDQGHRAGAQGRWLRSRYGITKAEYDRRHEVQEGRCAVCGGTEPGKGRSYFCVDHDHVTGAVRGLLCVACNTALGLLGDSPDRLTAAINYLRGMK